MSEPMEFREIEHRVRAFADAVAETGEQLADRIRTRTASAGIASGDIDPTPLAEALRHVDAAWSS